jgi:type IV pilus assembly protein PilP
LSPRVHRAVLLAALCLPLAAFVACGDDPAQNPQTHPGQPVAAAGAAGPDGGADAAVDPSAGLPALPLRDFQEKDFTESEANRDPFRTYPSLFVTQAKAKVTLQRKVLVDRYALDELKLIGIITRASPRAMLIDPTAFGWVAQVGDFVGKAELVHSGGPAGADVAINWRVDRIREADVVFIREDPSHPEIPPTTRVVALRTAEEDAQNGRHSSQ